MEFVLVGVMLNSKLTEPSVIWVNDAESVLAILLKIKFLTCKTWPAGNVAEEPIVPLSPA